MASGSADAFYARMLVLLHLRFLNGYWGGEHLFAADSMVFIPVVVHRGGIEQVSSVEDDGHFEA